MYKVVTSMQVDPQGTRYKAYGISGPNETIADIALERKSIKTLARQMNKLQLDPIHFKDIIEDFLLQNCNRMS